MRGIDLLLDRNLPLKLKSMLLTINQHELWQMKEFAEERGVGFRFDPMVNPGIDRSNTPISYRLSPEEIIKYDWDDENRRKDWFILSERFSKVQINDQYMYQCGAGIHSFHINPYGKLNLCVMSREPAYDLQTGNFHDGWYNELKEARFQSPRKEYICNSCEIRAICGACPAWGSLEEDNPYSPIDFLCRMAQLRSEMFDNQRIYISQSQ